MSQPTDKQLKAIIESVLFVAERPVSLKELAEITGAFLPKVQEALAFLITAYKDKGINIIRKGDYFQFSTAPKNTRYVAKYLNVNIKEKLSKEALETLAIIFYNQPITKAEIEKIRKVDCESVLHNLQIRGLIANVERKKIPGKPMVYGTTMEFVQYFGIDNLKDLMEIGKSETVDQSEKLSFGLDTIKKRDKKGSKR